MPAFSVFPSLFGPENIVFLLITQLMGGTKFHLRIPSCLVIRVGDKCSYLPRQKKNFAITCPISQLKCSITELSENKNGISTLALSSSLILKCITSLIIFWALISAETHRYKSHMDLNVLWSWELGDYVMSFHFSLQLFLLFNLLSFLCVCWPLDILFFNTKFYSNKAQNT